MQNHRKIIDELNDIIQKNYDAVKGYRKVAEHANETRLVNFFNSQARERERFITDLQNEVRSLGGTPEKDGSNKGSLHRAWIDFKTALSFDKEESVLEACITGEKNSINEYNDLLEESGLPSTTRTLLMSQKQAVASALRQIETEEEYRD